MAFTQLKTNYLNDVLNTNVNTNIKYIKTDNVDGTISLQDATAYTTLGDSFDASVINSTNTVVNTIGTHVTQNETNITNLLAGKINIDTSALPGTIDGDLYAALVALGWESDVIV